MTRALSRIPPELRDRPLPVGRQGAGCLSRGVTQHPRFTRSHRGIARVLHPDSLSSNQDGTRMQTDSTRMHALAAEYAPLLRPGEGFSHTCALLIYGVPIRAPLAVHVVARLPAGQVRRPHVLGHRTSAPLALRDAKGLRCVSPLTALIQSATLLSFRELVVAIDALVLPRGREGEASAVVPVQDLVEALRQRRDRGIVRLRAAAEVAREGAESRYETLLRFELARMGLDDLDLQVDVCDGEGYWIGRFDLVDRTRKLIIEYDGEQHRTDRAQYLKDLRRLERAREAGYRILRLHKDDFRPERLDATRQRLCRFLGRAPVPIAPHLARLFAEC